MATASLRRLTLAALLLAAAAAGGCRFFQPAQPEIPSDRNIVTVDYTTIENTLETIRLAIQDKSATNGQAAYIQAFTDPGTDGVAFTTTFDPLTVARFSGVSTEWDIDREELFYASLSRLHPTSQFVFTWGEYEGAPNDEPNATPAVIYRSYELLATGDGGSTYTTVAVGNAELHFIQVGTQWKIVKWIDSEDPDADFDNDELSFGALRLSGGS